MTANASPAVLAPVDVDKVLATMRRAVQLLDLDGSKGVAANLHEARAAVEQMAADLAAAREDAATWREQHAICTRDLQNADRRLKAAEADAARYRDDWHAAMDRIDKLRQRAETAEALIPPQPWSKPHD